MKVLPWMIILQRSMGCQFINCHNVAISSVLNCNTNVQIGDASQVYYSTLYNSKSTQKEYSERVQRVIKTITRKLIRIEGEIPEGRRDPNDVQDGFVGGLCLMLSRLNAAR